jgi:hypothetical protein
VPILVAVRLLDANSRTVIEFEFRKCKRDRAQHRIAAFKETGDESQNRGFAKPVRSMNDRDALFIEFNPVVENAKEPADADDFESTRHFVGHGTHGDFRMTRFGGFAERGWRFGNELIAIA